MIFGRSSPLRQVFRGVPLSRTELGFAAILAIMEALTALVFPLMTKGLIDEAASGSGGLGSLDMRSVATISGVLIAGAVLGAFSSYFFARQGALMAYGLKTKLSGALLRRKLAYHLRTPSGALVSRITADADTVAKFFGQQVQGLLVAVITLIGSVAALFVLDAVLTSVILGVIAIAFVVVFPIVAVVGAASTRISANGAQLSGLLGSIFGQVALVKSYVAEEFELGRIGGVLEAIRRDVLRIGRINAILAPLMSLTVTLSAVVVVVYGAMRLIGGHISAGTLTAFLLYIVSIVAPLIQISMAISAYHAAVGSSAWLREVLEDKGQDEPRDNGHLTLSEVRPGTAVLRLRNLSFTHEGTDNPVLNKASVTFHQGEMVALVGASGAGKSTLLFLIDRLLEPTSGTIEWASEELARYAMNDWRRSVRYVSQDNPVIAGTIRDNVLYGADFKLGDEAVRRALRMAQLDSFIDGLPGGLDARVEERGGNLSGGQRQRLAIARVFVANPSVVLVDEGTSALDADTEASVINALKLFSRDRLVVFVSHRPAVLEIANRVIQLDSGQLTELAGSARPSELYPCVKGQATR